MLRQGFSLAARSTKPTTTGKALGSGYRQARNVHVLVGNKASFEPKTASIKNQWNTQLFFLNQQPIAKRYYASLPSHAELGLPALSPTMEKGNIAKWKKNIGDKIVPGDVIAEIETDKATVDFEATEEGYLAAILHPEGSKDLNVGIPIAIVVENAKDVAAFKDYKAGAAPAAAPAPAKKEAPAAAPAPAAEAPKKQETVQYTPPPTAAPSGKVVPGAPPAPQPRKGAASPAARATAAEEGVQLSSIQGSGPNGRIVRDDVLRAAQQPATAKPVAPAATGAAFTDIPHTQIRRVIASRLTTSKQTIPHYYLSMDIQMDKLLQLRTHLNDTAKGKFKLSVNDFVVKAAALACKKVPEANSSWMDDAIRKFHSVDINVAVNTDKGLLTPLLPKAENMGLSTINSLVKSLAEKGKEGKLSPAELATGTFTISNLGMFGIKNFSAVINPPQACILAVGATEKKLIPSGSSTEQYAVADFMTVTLSCDHRVVDGAIGAQWLQAFKEYMEDPAKMLL